MIHSSALLSCAFLALSLACASSRTTGFPTSPAPKLNDDEFTRYELLEPESHAFRLTHEVSAVDAGARTCFLFMRGGAIVNEVAAEDRFTGEKLNVGLLDGEDAEKLGRLGAVAGETYLAVPLARPVPADGETRLVIRMRYEDPETYRFSGDRILFERLLGSKGVAIVLPPAYVIVSASHPLQVRELGDGRIEASLLDPARDWITLRLEGRRLGPASESVAAHETAADTPEAPTSQEIVASTSVASRSTAELPSLERAHEDREIVYFLEAPETHAFRLYHDYTETRTGIDKYLNVVRPGSHVSNPSAVLLDTGEALVVEEMSGEEVLAAGWSDDDLRPESEVVVVHHPPVVAGRSMRIRIEETYSDSERYFVAGDELVWNRSFGRPRNALVLPRGWHVVANAIPATISETADGRIRLDYVNARPDSIAVYLRARRDAVAQ